VVPARDSDFSQIHPKRMLSVGRQWIKSAWQVVSGGASEASGVQDALISNRPLDAWTDRVARRARLASHDGEDLEVEALAAFGVAAAAVGRYAAAVADFREAVDAAALKGDLKLEDTVRRLAEHAELLAQQSVAAGGFRNGARWLDETSPLDKGVPEAWAPWLAALPKTAEYCGPVVVGLIADGNESSAHRRGLLAERPVAAGEVLLVSRPIAWAENSGTALVDELLSSARSSRRSRRWLACLDDGSGKESGASLHDDNSSLRDLSQENGPEPNPDDASNFDLQGIIKTNAFRTGTSGSSAIYGLPSMCNHSCDGFQSSVLRHIRADGSIVLWAARDLAEGEEILIRYFRCDAPVKHRQTLSVDNWGFACGCRRCTFERCRLPASPAATAIDTAMAEWKSHLKQDMQALSTTAPAKSEGAAVATPCTHTPRRFVQAVMELIDKVEAAASDEAEWAEAELAWCLALVLPLLNAALWCLLAYKDDSRLVSEASIEPGDHAEPAAATSSYRTLRHLALVWRYTECFGFDHLQTLHLLWSSAVEARAASVGASDDCGVQEDMAGAEHSQVAQDEKCIEERQSLQDCFCIRFGVSPEALRLGMPDSQVPGLLRRLKV